MRRYARIAWLISKVNTESRTIYYTSLNSTRSGWSGRSHVATGTVYLGQHETNHKNYRRYSIKASCTCDVFRKVRKHDQWKVNKRIFDVRLFMFCSLFFIQTKHSSCSAHSLKANKIKTAKVPSRRFVL